MNLASNVDILKRIKTELLTDDQYYQEETKKDFVVLHHTVSPGDDASGDIRWWLSDVDRVATHCIITQDGTIHQTIKSIHWGHHLGCKAEYFEKYGLTPRNTDLNKRSYSIEFDCLGPVDKDGNSLAYKKLKAKAGVYDLGYNFRGFRYFEKYTDAQLESAYHLIKLIATNNPGIDLKKVNLKTAADFDMNKTALSGKLTGVWTHVNFRPDKSDCFPQKELLEMLSSF
jgi:N-acetyl-anhydromuramyl-L-alanine amidase AmpD